MIAELPSLYRQATVTTGHTKDCDILIVAGQSTSEWIQSVQKSIRRHENRNVIRGRNRNAPCPCGCGKKSKRCKGVE